MATSGEAPDGGVPPHVEQLLVEMLIAQGKRQEMIRLMEIEAHELRQQLRAADSSPLSKPGGTPSIPLSASTTRAMSPASSLSLDVSTDDPFSGIRRQLFDSAPEAPSLIPIPLRGIVHAFTWDNPPIFWPQEAKNIFQLVKENLPLRRLWHSFAHANHFATWLDALEDDILFFDRERRTLNYSIHTLPQTSAQTPSTFLGGFEDFLVEELSINFCLGTNPYNNPPGTAFLPSTSSCIAFGATPLALGDILFPDSAPLNYFVFPNRWPNVGSLRLLTPQTPSSRTRP